VTVTASERPTSSVNTPTERLSFAFTMTARRSTGWKPSDAICSVYSSGATVGKTKSPDAFVFTVCVVRRRALTSVTEAPERGAPCPS
jgi:hypothetical protein